MANTANTANMANAANIISICGIKNSGKTTLVSGLVRYLSGRGLRVAVIKHDGHDFACDIPGTDTSRFTENGAYGVACYSESRVFVHRVGTDDSFDDMVRLFPEADIILVEGLKNSTLDKIEVIRQEVSEISLANPEGLFLIATDLPADRFDVPVADINDIQTIAKTILEKIKK